LYSFPGRLAGFAILHAPYDVSMLPDRMQSAANLFKHLQKPS